MADNAGIGMPHDATAPTTGRGWQITWGVLLIVVGVAAILMPGIAALATVLFLGWLLAFGGGFEIAYAIHTREQQGFGWKLVSALLTLALGIAIVIWPVAGIASLGLLVGAFFFVGGITRTWLAFRLKPARGWGWVLFDGLLSVVLAVLIAIGWPGSSVEIIAVLTGFWLLFSGIWRVALSRYVSA